MKYKPVKAGDVFSFRLPKNTPEDQIKALNKMRNKLERDFGKEIAPLFMEAVVNYTKASETVTVPLPRKLTRPEREKFNDIHVKHLIGHIVFQLILTPRKAIKWPEDTKKDKQQPDKKGFAETFAEKNLFDDL